MEVPTVAVISGAGLPDERVFDAVAELFGVRFAVAQGQNLPACDAAVLVGCSRADVLRVARGGVRCIGFVGDALGRSVRRSGEVRFSGTPFVEPFFQGFTLADKNIEGAVGLSEEPGDEVIARQDGEPLWIRSRQAVSVADLVAVALPVLNPSELLFSRFASDNWFSLLPLLHFVKEIARWNFPPVRACFMFDDPNLHWPSYGYVKYQAIASDAERHDYHVSFATVPLDGWFVHPGTARTFREQRRRLSLLIHGNNHTHHELAQKLAPSKRIGLAAQAIRRVERIERILGVPVPRIMAAPHGACNEDVGEALLRAGFAGACISRSSLMARNPDVRWPLSAGLRPAEFFRSGLPVFPRFSLQVDPRTRVRLAAFLGQPVIPVGHHEDLAAGLGLLRERAALINTMPDVRWANMDVIATSNYWTRRNGEVLRLRMFSRTIAVPIPSGVSRVLVDRPWLSQSESEPLVTSDNNASPTIYESYRGEPFAVEPDSVVTVRSVCPQAVNPYEIALPTTMPRAIVRRQLCELRDRLRPVVEILLKRASRT